MGNNLLPYQPELFNIKYHAKHIDSLFFFKNDKLTNVNFEKLQKIA